MRQTFIFGLLSAFATILLNGCTTEDATVPSLQVANQEVVFNLFESSISDMDTRGDDTSTSLAASKCFNELEIAMIPDGKEEVDTNYVVRQDTTKANFGQVKMYVPAGKYHLVAVASKSPTKLDKRIDIKSTQEVDFPNDRVCDMAYLYKEVTIGTEKNNIDCNLKRGVSSLVIHSVDEIPTSAKSISVEMSGNCGNVFNPSTGQCKSTNTISRTFDMVTKNYGHRINITIYTILKSDDESAIKVTLKAIDQKDQAVRSYTFNNVHLVKGKKTTYSGPLYSSTNSCDFKIDEPSILDSGFNQTFE